MAGGSAIRLLWIDGAGSLEPAPEISVRRCGDEPDPDILIIGILQKQPKQSIPDALSAPFTLKGWP